MFLIFCWPLEWGRLHRTLREDRREKLGQDTPKSIILQQMLGSMEKCDKENWSPEVISQSKVTMSRGRNIDDAMNEMLMEKIKGCLPKIQENAEIIRTTLAKFHARATSSDRKTREQVLGMLWSKEAGAVEMFIMLLETSKDNVACCSILGILHECISPRLTKVKAKGAKNKNSMKAFSRATINQLISSGGTQVLIKLLMNSQYTDSLMCEVLTQEVLWILGQIAQKDQKFVTKVKLLNATKVFHTLLKAHYNDARMLLPLLLIFKSFSKNTSTVQTLVKEGIAAIFEKTFVCIGYTPHLKLKILLESFKHFTASRLFCAKFVKVGMVHLLMRIFDRWDRYDGSLRLKIANCALSTLYHLCSIKTGRRAIKANNGLQLLYRFCINCPEDRAYDFLLSRVCGIINQCLEKKELPVPEKSPARFNLPTNNEGHVSNVDSCSDADSQVNSVHSLGGICSDLDSGDDDDDCTSGNETKKFKEINEVDEGQFFAGVVTSQRTAEDLLIYNIHFNELKNIQTQIKCEGASTVPQDKTETLKGRRDSAKLLNLECGLPHQARKLKALQIDEKTDPRTAYCLIASKIRSIIPFVKVAYPDMINSGGRGIPEPLNDKDRKVCRAKLLTNVDRSLRPTSISAETIFDLDTLINTSHPGDTEKKILKNVDEHRVGYSNVETKSLQFESRFESGNLRRAVQIGTREYDLILSPDVNSGSRHQWFYFEVYNMEANIPYTFNIINCEKANSQFNFGMKPIMFSVIEAQLGRPGWIRVGSDICYYRNSYRRPGRGKNYMTTSFTVNFPHSYDVCYLAYHFPFTYSGLLWHIWTWMKNSVSEPIYFNADVLCDTINKNECPVLTITSPNSRGYPINNRKIIFLTSRVHPGESNASWVMRGTLETLLDNSTYMRSLRNDYIFKIVPMLNIDGVINGCNRYGLTNEDLNRRWSNPNRVLHPVIYHTKGLMEYCVRVLLRPPHVFVDYHGHSRRKNVFLFGCSRSGSWSAADRALSTADQPVQYLMLPRLMQKTSAAFALPLCSFKVERNKESTARVAIWRQLGVTRSYTMESSFCGCDQGVLAGLHLDTVHLKNVGKDFCAALAKLKDNDENWTMDDIIMSDETTLEERDSDTETSLSEESEDSTSDID
ncbi:cytosolic carboxypeptidase 1-like isoform X3 [Diachasmimorpha longicaudata]|uniref:cytosolic carboxypeptidase 1-like isoform X3 n=1 Tax=Diachasmimorpha longicaudata TaxID=58733 RepID=UPI0030B88D10